jgi:hypothetical protein
MDSATVSMPAEVFVGAARVTAVYAILFAALLLWQGISKLRLAAACQAKKQPFDRWAIMHSTDSSSCTYQSIDVSKTSVTFATALARHGKKVGRTGWAKLAHATAAAGTAAGPKDPILQKICKPNLLYSPSSRIPLLQLPSRVAEHAQLGLGPTVVAAAFHDLQHLEPDKSCTPGIRLCCFRYNDKRMLPYDRTIGNFMEWAVPFLCLFWIRCGYSHLTWCGCVDLQPSCVV